MNTEIKLLGGGGGGSSSSGTVMITYTISGKPLDAQVIILSIVGGVSVSLPEDLTGSKGASGTVADALSTFTIYKNTTSIGTFQFAAAASTCTFTFSSGVTLNGDSGDYLKIIAPATADSTLADIGVTFKGTLG